MFVPTTSRWVLALLLRQPLFWLFAVLSAATWPTVAVFSPLGLTTTQGTPPGLLYELVFLCLVVGQTIALGMEERLHWLLAPLSPLRRAGVVLAAGASASGLLLLAGPGTAALLGAPLPHGLPLLLTHLHLSAVTLLLVNLPSSAVPRLVVLPLVTWILPALLGGVRGVGPVVVHLLGADRHLHATWVGTDQVLAALPIAGLALAALVLGARAQLPRR